MSNTSETDNISRRDIFKLGAATGAAALGTAEIGIIEAKHLLKHPDTKLRELARDIQLSEEILQSALNMLQTGNELCYKQDSREIVFTKDDKGKITIKVTKQTHRNITANG
jgi:hypothetical protein